MFTRRSLTSVIYTNRTTLEGTLRSSISRALAHAVDSYDLSTDPYAIDLVENGDENSDRQLTTLLMKPKTYCYKQLKSLHPRANAILDHLGASAADWYICECIRQYNEYVRVGTSVMIDLSEKERDHLRLLFDNLLRDSKNEIGTNETYMISDKVRSLIRLLNECSPRSVRGIIFVEQRAIAVALAHILRSHPKLQAGFSIGTFVGTSTFTSRKTTVGDLLDLKQQQQDLVDFRKGTKNLMIATHVLEEGIDVTACNLVICFDPPKNLVSFVQCRGRARQRDSKYVVFLAAQDLKSDPSKWQRFESDMKQAYMDGTRQLVSTDTGEENIVGPGYRVEHTGALLTYANAKAHLYHFCAIASSHASRYINLRPEFTTTNNGGLTPWSARVDLPSFVHPSVRAASSSKFYRTEAAAIKDSAFEAYVALHRAKLVGDNLLPLRQEGPEFRRIDQPSIIKIRDRLSPWSELLQAKGSDGNTWHAGTLKLVRDGCIFLSVLIWLPTALPEIPAFSLYWNQQTTYIVKIQPLDDTSVSEDSNEIKKNRTFTHLMLHSVHGHHMEKETSLDNNFPLMFSPADINDKSLSLDAFEGRRPATEVVQRMEDGASCGLVRCSSQTNKSFIFAGTPQQSETTNSAEINVRSFPKRKDFLHPMDPKDTQKAAYTAVQALPIDDCTVDNLPIAYAVLAAFVPSIQHRIEVALLARHIQRDVLAKVNIKDSSLITEAITAPQTGEQSDYNRLEFLGDSILKFCAVLQVTAQNLNWPEGYLSWGTYVLVSNNILTKVGLELGLEGYILTKRFTGSKWRPRYLSGLCEQGKGEGKEREVSSKVIADVVEALIGAAYVDVGLEKAFNCLRMLHAGQEWYAQENAIERLLGEVGAMEHVNLSLLERLIGHKFKRSALLLEAITHASFPHNRSGLSYERLEFLGDAVLDILVVPKIFAHEKQLKHWELHRIREALVSAPYLGYCCMRYSIEEETFQVVEHQTIHGERQELEKSSKSVHLHDFLRASIEMTRHKQHSLRAFEEYRHVIDEGMERGKEYPWPDLIAMKPQKFFSDMIESVLGALFLDTKGDLAVCEAFIEKLGILRHMRRILDEGVETAFPKEQLGILAESRVVEYEVSRTVDAGEGSRAFTCILKVGGKIVATVTGCGSKDEAEARAAYEGKEVLRDQYAAKQGHRKRKLDVVVNEMRDERGLSTGEEPESQR